MARLSRSASRKGRTDADLSPNDVTVEVDETNGVFRLRGKDSNGNVIERTVSYS